MTQSLQGSDLSEALLLFRVFLCGLVLLEDHSQDVVHSLCFLNRRVGSVLSWDAVPERTTAAFQVCLERAPRAKQYYSDVFPTYDNLYYDAHYELIAEKCETYSVEAVNADLCHCLKRLARRLLF